MGHELKLGSAVVLTAALAACGGETSASDDRPRTISKKAPAYAATPRQALEAWVGAVQAGNIVAMCRLLRPKACKIGGTRTSLLPHVRKEMHGLKGDLRYNAVKAARGYPLIGVVTGNSPMAYAVPLSRRRTQWIIGDEVGINKAASGETPDRIEKFAPQIELESPDPARPLQSGSAELSLTFWAGHGSGYPLRDVWIDSRRIDGRFSFDPEGQKGVLTPGHWQGTVRLGPGRHVVVAAVFPYTFSARAWVLTVE